MRMASREPFLIGGLWDTWHYGRDDALATFTVLQLVVYAGGTLPEERLNALKNRELIAGFARARNADAAVP